MFAKGDVKRVGSSGEPCEPSRIIKGLNSETTSLSQTGEISRAYCLTSQILTNGGVIMRNLSKKKKKKKKNSNPICTSPLSDVVRKCYAQHVLPKSPDPHVFALKIARYVMLMCNDCAEFS